MPSNEYKPIQKYYRFALYMVVLILINIVGSTLFFRMDLTSNSLYSLSDASKKVVGSLKEPLTVNVFFSKNLPPPYSNVETYLHDLLQEFEIYSDKNLNYRFYDVTAKEGDLSEKEQENRKLAESYGINPVNVQKIEQDEAKVQRAYMGIVLLHGDLVEKIPEVTATDGLEYKITSAIKKMTGKVSALQKLPEKIKVSLVVTSSLSQISRLVNLQGLDTLKSTVQSAVDRTNSKTYGQLVFVNADPTMGEGTSEQLKVLDRFGLQWPEIKTPEGTTIPAGKGVAAIQMQYGKKTVERNLLNRKPMLTNQGVVEQFSIIDVKEIENFISDNVDNLIEINDGIGYLKTNGVKMLGPDLPDRFEPGMPRPPKQEYMENLNTILNKVYSVKELKLDNDIPGNIETLIIAGPKEPFTEWQLFQIDQFLMKGKSLAIFIDSFNEIQAQSQQGFQEPVYLPINTGLEKLVDFYGLQVKKSYLMDESCYVNKDRSGEQMPIYFAPMIKNENINHKLPFLENLKQLILIKASPLEAIQERIKQNNLKLTQLFTSTEKSWEMKGRISLMPFNLQPPMDPKERGIRPLAYLLEGEFPSYFANKPIPEKPEPKPATPEVKKEEGARKEGEKKEEVKPEVNAPVVKGTKDVITRGKPGKIFLIGCSEILRNNVIDEEMNSPNAVFLLNTLDYLNHREDIAVMRGKNQQFNPLDDAKPFTKTIVKIFNVGGLPALFILLGIIIWIRRIRRKRKIQLMFTQSK